MLGFEAWGFPGIWVLGFGVLNRFDSPMRAKQRFTRLTRNKEALFRASFFLFCGAGRW
jgi:hypothetical protein